MEDDPTKIRKIIAYLKTVEPDGDWEDTNGYQAMMTVTKNPLGGVSFNASSGVIIKGFLNKKTGEIRTFYWKTAAKD